LKNSNLSAFLLKSFFTMRINSGRSSSAADMPTALVCEGFTLIELLVAIVIIGMLSAIALPSFLNQSAKAKGSEAKSNLGAVNRSQQAYRWENSIFASDLTDLDVKISGRLYSYSISSGNAITAKTITTSQQAGLKILSAAVNQSGDIFTQVICESSNTQLSTVSSTVPTGGGGSPLECPSGYASTQ
jgi:type IV pilus assembly protein PilA